MSEEKSKTKSKERWGEGRGPRPQYRLKPRYSTFNAVTLNYEEEAEKFIAKEKEMYERAIDGKLGGGMTDLAEREGLHGIAEKLTPCAHGWFVEDLIDTEIRYMQPAFGHDMSGLWELTCDFENPDADRRVKDNWLMAPVWKKGMRFVLRRNDTALQSLLSMAKEADNDIDEQAFIERAGYLVRAARAKWKHHEARLDKFPREFGMSLRPVPISSARAAIDLIGPEDYNLREVLMHIVDKEKIMVPWKLANLLEQSCWGEGPFSEFAAEAISREMRELNDEGKATK